MKRTKQLDNAKEVALPTLGKDVFTTIGELALTGSEQEEKLAKQVAGKRRGQIQQIVQSIRAVVNERLEGLIQQVAPLSVLSGGEGAVARWLTDEGFTFRRDGLTWVVKHRGNVVAELPIQVPIHLIPEVLAMFKEDESGINN